MPDHSGHESTSIDEPLYNSRLVKNYVEYVKKFHPEVNIDHILSEAWINSYELDDQGHWFSQWQIDRFHELLSRETGDKSIPREAGRYAGSSQSVQRQYILGFLSLESVYVLMEKINPILTRAANIKTKKLGPNKVEVVSTPKPGVNEKQYQCENRIGLFESLAKLFTNKYPAIEHSTCFHRGDDCCRYVITWERTPSLTWKKIKSYSLLISLLVVISFFFFLPLANWIVLIILCGFLTMTFAYYSERLEKIEISRAIESQGNAAKDLIDEINTRYNNARLIQEIGQATSMLMDTKYLLQSVMTVMEKRLDFDRGGIWMANKKRTRLVWQVGYGYDSSMEKTLKEKRFHLDNPNSKGIGVLAFKQRKPFLVNEISSIENQLSESSREFIRSIGSKSFIGVPIAFKGESLGLLFVDNLKSKKPLTQSDMSLVMGIAPQIATSIHNSISYQQVKESNERELNLRKLFERYVPPSVIRRYVSGNVDLFGGEQSDITALFLDIRDFTSSTESMDPRDVVSFLNDYFEQCSVIISKERGHINKYTGDGFLAIFNAPETLEDHEMLSFKAVCNIMSLSDKYIFGEKPIEIGIGIHTGSAILGNLGSQTKLEYTAIGDTVNVAARLQELTKTYREYPVIMSKDFWEKIRDRVPPTNSIKSLGVQVIRGKKDKLETYGLNPVELN